MVALQRSFLHGRCIPGATYYCIVDSACNSSKDQVGLLSSRPHRSYVFDFDPSREFREKSNRFAERAFPSQTPQRHRTIPKNRRMSIMSSNVARNYTRCQLCKTTGRSRARSYSCKSKISARYDKRCDNFMHCQGSCPKFVTYHKQLLRIAWIMKQPDRVVLKPLFQLDW
jgi:hypothetical protein